jgi:redox-sensitive bicupin YhaK (pirin superfamily)
MGFRSLRVINEDRVAPGGGFPNHPHQNMEIFSYVIDGALEHQDSMGNGRRLTSGQIQLMSAGTGVTHSEFNPSTTESVHFLQIWITPQQNGLTPNYSEWHPAPNMENSSKVLLISADGRDNSARIQQDANVYRIRLAAGESIEHALKPGRGLWLQMISGTATAHECLLKAGDGASTECAGNFEIHANVATEALLFDLG